MTKRAYLFEIWRTDDFDRKERKQLEHAKKQWRWNVALSVGRCTAPWSLVHIGLVFKYWRNPISIRNRCMCCTRSQRLLFLIVIGVSSGLKAFIKSLYVYFTNREKREIQRDWKVKHSFEADWKKKISALCGTKGKKKMWFFFYSRHTRKINWRFSLGQLFGCYNHRELKYSEWKILLTGFVVRLYLFLEILLYFPNLLWTQVLGITWVL